MTWLQHFALARDPFATPEHADDLFETRALREARSRLGHLFELRGIGLLTGESGCGKTSVARQAAGRLHPSRHRIVYISLTTGSVIDTFQCLAWGLGLPTVRTRAVAYRAIRSEITRLACESGCRLSHYCVRKLSVYLCSRRRSRLTLFTSAGGE